jgi:hypothetical protein
MEKYGQHTPFGHRRLCIWLREVSVRFSLKAVTKQSSIESRDGKSRCCVFETTAVSFLCPIGNRRKGGQFVGLNKYMQQWPAFLFFLLVVQFNWMYRRRKKVAADVNASSPLIHVTHVSKNRLNYNVSSSINIVRYYPPANKLQK